MRLLHLSISADDPERVAGALAGLMDGRALPFPPFPDSWIAFSGADDGTAIEVYPTTHVLTAGPDQVSCDVQARDASPTFAHVAFESPLSSDDIFAAAKDQGWLARVCNRGPFHCIEVWVENRLLVEVLDPAMARDYRQNMTVAGWAAMFHMS